MLIETNFKDQINDFIHKISEANVQSIYLIYFFNY